MGTIDRSGLSKILIYGFWYDYVKPFYGEKAKLQYRDTGSFIVCIKTDDINKDTAEVVETRFDTPNDQLECNFIAKKIKIKKSNQINER